MAKKYFVVLFDIKLEVLGRFKDEYDGGAEIEFAEAFTSFQMTTIRRVLSAKSFIETLAKILFRFFVVGCKLL